MRPWSLSGIIFDEDTCPAGYLYVPAGTANRRTKTLHITQPNDGASFCGARTYGDTRADRPSGTTVCRRCRRIALTHLINRVAEKSPVAIAAVRTWASTGLCPAHAARKSEITIEYCPDLCRSARQLLANLEVIEEA